MDSWKYPNNSGDTIIVVVAGGRRDSALPGEVAYFRAAPSQWMEVYRILGYDPDDRPILEEAPERNGRVERLAGIHTPTSGG